MQCYLWIQANDCVNTTLRKETTLDLRSWDWNESLECTQNLIICCVIWNLVALSYEKG